MFNKEAARVSTCGFFGQVLITVLLVIRVFFEEVQKSSSQGCHHTHANCAKRTIKSSEKNGVARIVPWYIPGQ
jgi:hypothetical protein